MNLDTLCFGPDNKLFGGLVSRYTRRSETKAAGLGAHTCLDSMFIYRCLIFSNIHVCMEDKKRNVELFSMCNNVK